MKKIVFLFVLIAGIAWATPPPNFHLVFDSAFRGGLSVSDWGPCGAGGSTWIAHTPNAKDFGIGWFGIQDGSELTVTPDGYLQLKAFYDQSAGHWRGALIASIDPNGNGFSASGIQYWEARMNLPPGAFPSFWLLGVDAVKGTFPVAELDVVEAYHDWWRVDMTSHRLNADGTDTGTGAGDTVILTGWENNWHTYAILIWDDFTYFLVDDIQCLKIPTDPSYLRPLFCMVDLAIQYQNSPSPSIMLVDYIRCYLP